MSTPDSRSLSIPQHTEFDGKADMVSVSAIGAASAARRKTPGTTVGLVVLTWLQCGDLLHVRYSGVGSVCRGGTIR